MTTASSAGSIIVTVVAHLLLLGIGAGQSKAEFGCQASNMNIVLTSSIRVSTAFRPVVTTTAMTAVTAGINKVTGDDFGIPSGLALSEADTPPIRRILQ